MLIKEDVGWYGRANFGAKLNDSVHLIPLIRSFDSLQYIYVACLKLGMWFVFALCGLIVFIIYWVIAHSEPFQTSTMELFGKIVTSKEVTSLLRHLAEF